MPSQTANGKKTKPSVAELQSTIDRLQQENQVLQSKNKKMRRDCTNFARRLKQIEDSGILDIDVSALQEENEQLRDQMSEMQRQLNQLTAVVQDQQGPQKKRFSPKSFLKKTNQEEQDFEEVDQQEEDPIEAESLGDYTSQYAEEDYISPEELPIEEDFGDLDSEDFYEPKHPSLFKREKRESKEATPFVLAEPTTGVNLLRNGLTVLLVLVILSLIVSGITGLFATKFTDATLFGQRFYTVVNTAAEDSGITMDDIVLVKCNSIEDAKVKDVILNTAHSRSFATVTEIGVNSGETTLTVTDGTGSYSVTSSEYLGTASKKVSGVGKLVRYACQHSYNYYAYHLAAILILIAVLLLIPSKKRQDIEE